MDELNDFFTNYLPNKLTENPGLAKDINAVYMFDLDGYGKWSVDLTEGSGSVSEGAHASPGCTVTAKAEDFAKLLENPSSGMMMFTMGKLKVDNVGLALSLQKLLS